MRSIPKTIGVTGAAGFIGSNLCQKLIDKGYKVIAIDNLSKGSKKNISEFLSHKNFTFSEIDITKSNSLNRVFKDIDVLVHLAAAKIPRYGGRLETLLINTHGTENLLELIKAKRIKFIFISTSDVYGKSPNLPFKETGDLATGSPEVARWAYAVSKIFDEHLCFAYWEKYKVPFVILRLFGVYGPKQHRSWWGGPQSLFIDRIIQNKSVDIHGDGKQTRSFIYIDDVTEAIIKSITSKSAENNILNIGTETEISILELAKLIANLLHKKLKIVKVPYDSFTNNKYEDIQRRVPDIKNANKILNWNPRVGMKEGLMKTINWNKNHPI